MVDALPHRIFLASPGDLGDERDVIRVCVDEHNARGMGESHVTYEVIGWERVRGTARRPQEAINELIGESHFLIALFKASWGSKPGNPWGYTSGTEEELFSGLLELGLAGQPMRDVRVAFLDHPAPADQIVQLREEMSRRRSIMYESIADIRELKEKLTERLEAWEAAAGSTKVPRHVDLFPSSGKDVLGAASCRLRGEQLVYLGQAEAGRAALKKAAGLGGPVEQLAYARFWPDRATSTRRTLVHSGPSSTSPLEPRSYTHPSRRRHSPLRQGFCVGRRDVTSTPSDGLSMR